MSNFYSTDLTHSDVFSGLYRCQVFQSNSIQRQEIVDNAASFAYVLTYIEIKPFPTDSQVFAFWILNEQQLFSVFILKSDLDCLSSTLPVLGYNLCVFVWKKNIFTTKMKAYFMQQLPSSHNYHVLSIMPSISKFMIFVS